MRICIVRRKGADPIQVDLCRPTVFARRATGHHSRSKPTLGRVTQCGTRAWSGPRSDAMKRARYRVGDSKQDYKGPRPTTAPEPLATTDDRGGLRRPRTLEVHARFRGTC